MSLFLYYFGPITFAVVTTVISAIVIIRKFGIVGLLFSLTYYCIPLAIAYPIYQLWKHTLYNDVYSFLDPTYHYYFRFAPGSLIITNVLIYIVLWIDKKKTFLKIPKE